MPSEMVHINITRAAVLESRNRPSGGILDEIIDGIIEGVVDPDRNPDKMIVHSGYVQTKTNVDHSRPNIGLVDYYFNLSLYHLRKGNKSKAGFMLGRALHYVQDRSFKASSWKYAGELASSPQRILGLCRTAIIGEKKSSSIPEEALCIAFKRSVELLNRFIEEYREPINISELEEKVKRIRTLKAMIWMALSAFAILLILRLTTVLPEFSMTLAVFFSFLATIILAAIVAAYQPKTYQKAMRAGLMIIKPANYEPAY